MAQVDLEASIKNRESWVRTLLLTAGGGVLIWKFFGLDLSGVTIDFSQLLALILSLFAIWLSVAFYHKATEQSSAFYDNVYKFTKDVSENLGRIEAGFGERLKHLDEGYTGLRDSVARMPLDRNAASQAIKGEEEKAKKAEEEKQELIEKLLVEARYKDEEKERFKGQLAGREAELRRARSEVRSLRDQVAHSAPPSGGPSSSSSNRLEHMTGYVLRDNALAQLMPDGQPLTLQLLIERYDVARHSLHPGFLADMSRERFVTEAGGLTPRGARWLRNVILHGKAK